MIPEQMPDINLLPKTEKENSNVYALFLILVIVVVLAYTLIGVFYFMNKSKLSSLEGISDNLSAEVDELKIDIATLENKDDSLAQAVTFAEQNSMPTSKLITELTDLHTTHNYMGEYDYSAEGVTITNHFETLEDVAAYTTELNDSEVLKDAKVDHVDTYTLKEAEEQGVNDFSTIPRYEANYQLEVNKQALKGEAEADE